MNFKWVNYVSIKVLQREKRTEGRKGREEEGGREGRKEGTKEGCHHQNLQKSQKLRRKKERGKKKELQGWRRWSYFLEGLCLEVLSKRMTFTSGEAFRKGGNEPYGCLEKESPGRKNSK